MKLSKAAEGANTKKTELAQEDEVARPVGRPLQLTVETYPKAVWHEPSTLSELAASSNVVVSSYMFDEPAVHEALLKKLRGRSSFACDVFVDARAYEQKTCYHEGPRLRSLRDAGATVHLCTGKSGKAEYGPSGLPGAHHIKALILDRKIAYLGSANLTRAARTNNEIMHRFTGPPAETILSAVLATKNGATIL